MFQFFLPHHRNIFLTISVTELQLNDTLRCVSSPLLLLQEKQQHSINIWNEPITEETITYDDNNQLEFATLNKIIEALTSADELSWYTSATLYLPPTDRDLVETFLLMYKAVTTQKEVIIKLKER